jgi:hypothetical protein
MPNKTISVPDDAVPIIDSLDVPSRRGSQINFVATRRLALR